MMALLMCAFASQAAVQTKTVTIPFDFSAPDPRTAKFWELLQSYPDNGTTPIIQANPWGGYPTQDITGLTRTGSSPEMFNFNSLFMSGGGTNFKWTSAAYATPSVDALDWFRNDGIDGSTSLPEGHGSGLRIDPINPNSGRQSIRIKSVVGTFINYTGEYHGGSIPAPKRVSASFGGNVTISGNTFTWNANGQSGSTLGLFFWETCLLKELQVTVDILNGDDVTDADINWSYDDLYNQQWPPHLYSKALTPATSAVGQSKYRITHAQIVNIDEEPMPDVVADNFTCTTTSAQEIGSTDSKKFFTNLLTLGRTTLITNMPPFYPDKKYAMSKFSQYAESDRGHQFTARITREKEGTITYITSAKIYFTSEMGTTYNSSTRKYERYDGGKITRGGGAVTQGIDADGQYLLWTGTTKNLDLSFVKRISSSQKGTYSNDDNNYCPRVIKYVELTFDTQEGQSAHPALMSVDGAYVITDDGALTYQQAGGSVKVHSPSSDRRVYYVIHKDMDNKAISNNGTGFVIPFQKRLSDYSAYNPVQTAHGATISLPTDAKFVVIQLFTVGTDGYVADATRARLVNSTMTVRTAEELDAQRFTWKDINGTAHPDTKASEKATDPMHIAHLIKEVYTNPWYPGRIWYDPKAYTAQTWFNKSIQEAYSYSRTGTNIKSVREDTYDWLKTYDWESFWEIEINSPNADGVNLSSLNRVYNLNWPTEGNSVILLEARDNYDFFTVDNNLRNYVNAWIDGGRQTGPLTEAITGFNYGDLNGGSSYSSKWSPELVRLNETFKSAQLLPAVKHIENPSTMPQDQAYNPGTLFMFSGEYDRFYFISKGSYGNYYHEGNLFHHMYEEISPETSNMHTKNVYSALMSGVEPEMEHFCTNVPDRDHWLQMRENGEAQRLDNMTFYLPDYRNYFGQSSNYGAQQAEANNIYTGYRPYMGLYTVQLQAEAIQTSEKQDNVSYELDGEAKVATRYKYDLHPFWVTTMSRLEEKTNVPGSAAEEYRLYVQKLNTTTGEYSDWEQIEGDHSGYFWDAEHTYGVWQEPEAQYFNYRVYARLRDSGSEWVLSNEASVIVPGFDASRLIVLPVDIAHRSDFDVDDEHNHYKNHLTLVENSSKPMLADYLTAGTVMTVSRIDGHDQTHDEPMPFCNITVGAQFEENGVIKIPYTLSYANQESTSHFDASLVAEPTGHWTTNSLTDRRVVFGPGFFMLDQFMETVADNNHCTHHDYILEFTAETDGKTINYKSNRVRVPIYRTHLGGNTYGYSKSQVDDDHDTENLIEVDRNAYMTVNVEDHSNIQEYAALRNGTQRVSTAQRGATGNYTTFRADTEGKVTVVMDREHIYTGPVAGSMTLPLLDSIAPSDPSTRWYVTKIEVLTPNLSGSQTEFYNSTYGSPRVYVASPEVHVGTQMEMAPHGQYDDVVGFLVKLDITAGLPTEFEGHALPATEPYQYRVWRVKDGEEILINDLDDAMINTSEGRVSTNYSALSVDKAEKEVIIRDFWREAPLSSEKTVNYKIRLYSKLTGNHNNGAPRRVGEAPGGDQAGYAVAEMDVEVTFDPEVITSLNDIDMSKAQVVSVSYVNTLGQTSSKPWPGVNVVVTRFDNGVTVSVKQVMR